jgi:hypothetical protein
MIRTLCYRLYTGFGTQPRIVNRHGELFTWSSDESVKLFTLFPLITVHDFMCQHRDKISLTVCGASVTLYWTTVRKKYMNYCRPVIVTMKT